MLHSQSMASQSECWSATIWKIPTLFPSKMPIPLWDPQLPCWSAKLEPSYDPHSPKNMAVADVYYSHSVNERRFFVFHTTSILSWCVKFGMQIFFCISLFDGHVVKYCSMVVCKTNAQLVRNMCICKYATNFTDVALRLFSCLTRLISVP